MRLRSIRILRHTPSCVSDPAAITKHGGPSSGRSPPQDCGDQGDDEQTAPLRIELQPCSLLRQRSGGVWRRLNRGATASRPPSCKKIVKAKAGWNEG
jgi:hypothetical protein